MENKGGVGKEGSAEIKREKGRERDEEADGERDGEAGRERREIRFEITLVLLTPQFKRVICTID